MTEKIIGLTTLIAAATSDLAKAKIIDITFEVDFNSNFNNLSSQIPEGVTPN